MSFKAIDENKSLIKISEFTVAAIDTVFIWSASLAIGPDKPNIREYKLCTKQQYQIYDLHYK